MTTSAVDELRGIDAALEVERELRLRIFAPPPKLTVSQWADRNRVLTGVASAEPGRWRTDRAPYQRGIMDTFSDPMIERIVVMSSAQIGKTEIILNVVGYFMDQDPAPLLVLQPTLQMAQAFSKDRLKEMIRAAVVLRRKVKESGRRESEDTILHKQFPGGHITLVGANSSSSLAARPIRVVLNDEVDRFPVSANQEGDPVALAKKRTTTFWNRKEGLFSTPTIKRVSRIETAHDEGDQRKYYVPCPHCGHKQYLKWIQLDFESESYVCGDRDPETEKTVAGCGALIEEMDKPAMLTKGEWIATHPGRRTASFHINALYSPWVTWRELIAEFHDARKSPETLQVFVNTVLGETWEADAEKVDTDALSARREHYAAEVPDGVGILTAFVDVQRDWLELLVKGWGAGQESWQVAHHRILGSTSQADVWERLDPLLVKPYQHESGATMHIRAVGIDSGDGETTQHVYAFVAPRQRRAVAPCHATKGKSTRGGPALNAPAKRPNKYGVRVIPVGTDTAKDLVFQRIKLKREPGKAAPPGFVHFPMTQPHGMDDEYLEQFGREKVFVRYVKGVPIREYHNVPKGSRNEAIDLEVGALVMLHLLGKGVYDQLAGWVARVRKEGEELRASGKVPEAIPQTQWPETQQPQPPTRRAIRMPRPGGYVNKWKL